MKDALKLEQTITIRSQALHRPVGEDLVILQQDSGMYLSLDAIGRRIWELIREHGALPIVHAKLCEEFEADPETLKRDLLKLVEEMRVQGLVDITPLLVRPEPLAKPLRTPRENS